MKNMNTFILFALMAYSVCAQLPVDWSKYTSFVSSPYYYYNREVLPNQPKAYVRYQNSDESMLRRDAIISVMLQELKETKVMVENVKGEMMKEISNLKEELEQMKKFAEERFEAESFTSESNGNIQKGNKTRNLTEFLANKLGNFTVDYNGTGVRTARFCNCLLFSQVTTILSKDLAETKIKLNDLTTQLKGTTTIGKVPSSCADLNQLGYQKSGIFSIMGNKQVESVYCDFTKSYTDTGFQKLIGIVDIKTIRVSFYAQRSSVYTAKETTIPFDLLTLNVGNAMRNTGIFTAPTPGTYFFAYSGISTAGNPARVELQKNNKKIGQAFAASGDYETFALQATLLLVKGDQVKLVLQQGEIHENSADNYTNFVGFLLEEELA